VRNGNSATHRSFLIATRTGTELAMSLGRANEKKGGGHHENRNVIFSELAFDRHARSERTATAADGVISKQELPPE